MPSYSPRSRILDGATAVNADMDARLSRALGATPGHWLALRSDYDLAGSETVQSRVRHRGTKIAEGGE